MAAAILAAGLKALPRKIPLWRILPATGLMIFVFFAYDVGLIQRELKAHLGEIAPLVWVTVTLGVGVLALGIIRRPAAVTVALVVSAAFASPSVARIAAFATSSHRARDDAAQPNETATRSALSPNIYWIVLDG